MTEEQFRITKQREEIDRLAARVAELEAFLREVQRHTGGHCDGITSADCLEAIAEAVDRVSEAPETGGTP